MRLKLDENIDARLALSSAMPVMRPRLFGNRDLSRHRILPCMITAPQKATF